MDPFHKFGQPHGIRPPRASGDGPPSRAEKLDLSQAAPRERGWTLPRRQPFGDSAGRPARAGMDPLPSCCLIDSIRPPRASGDGPQAAKAIERAGTAAPRERGWTPVTLAPALARMGRPARAGMDPAANNGARISDRPPRASGDGPRLGAVRRLKNQAAPRERGWTQNRALSAWVKIGRASCRERVFRAV